MLNNRMRQRLLWVPLAIVVPIAQRQNASMGGVVRTRKTSTQVSKPISRSPERWCGMVSGNRDITTTSTIETREYQPREGSLRSQATVNGTAMSRPTTPRDESRTAENCSRDSFVRATIRLPG